MVKLGVGLTCLRSNGKSSQAARTKFSQSISRHFNVFITMLILSLCCQTVYATEVALSWDACYSAKGYRVYYGVESRDYQFMVDNGPFTQCTISELDPGQTYYITVTAYNDYGESDFANELIFSHNLCEMDFDSDGDIDGWELAEIIANPSTADLNEFALGFGRPACVN
jgi:hypothetical protein